MFGPLLLFPIASDAAGAAAFPLPLTGIPPGPRVFFQFIWLNTPACGGAGTLSASNALDVTVQ